MSEKQFYRIYLMQGAVNRVDIYDPSRDDLTLLRPELRMEAGSAGSLKFTMPPGHVYYDEIKLLSSTIAVWEDRRWIPTNEVEPDSGDEDPNEVEPDQDALIWVGRPVRISTDFFQRKTVECEGGLAFLSDSVQRANDYGSQAIHDLLGILLGVHNTQVEELRRIYPGTTTVTDATVAFRTDRESTMEALRRLVGDYGGWLRLRQDPEDYEWYLDWLDGYSASAEQEVQYGLNLLDMKQNWAGDSIATRVMPIGKDGLTIESVNSGSAVLTDAAAVALYGTITRVLEYSDCTSAANLKALGQAWLAARAPLSLEVDAADLYIIGGVVQPFRVGDLVRVRSEPHGVNTVLPITRMVLAMESGRKRVTLGTSGQKGLTQQGAAAVSAGSGGGSGCPFETNPTSRSAQYSGCVASGTHALAVGAGTTASGSDSHAEGAGTKADGYWSHAEGEGTKAFCAGAHTEGYWTETHGDAAHAEGHRSQANADYAHAEGEETTASGLAAHAEGKQSSATGQYSHAEGITTLSNGRGSHAEGYASAVGQNAWYAHAEGYATRADGFSSHAQNNGTIARGDSQTALGKYNVEDQNNTYAVIIGNGSDANNRSNALTVDWSGNAAVAGAISEGGTSLSAKYAPLNHNHDSAYAPLNHNHDSAYLPLAGGNISGNLAVSGALSIAGQRVRANIATEGIDQSTTVLADSYAVVTFDYSSILSGYPSDAIWYPVRTNFQGAYVLAANLWQSGNTVNVVYRNTASWDITGNAQSTIVIFF